MMHKVDVLGFTDRSQLLLPTSQVKLYWSLKLRLMYVFLTAKLSKKNHV